MIGEVKHAAGWELLSSLPPWWPGTNTLVGDPEAGIALHLDERSFDAVSALCPGEFGQDERLISYHG